MNVTKLPLAACVLLQLPSNGTDCSVSQPEICVECRVVGKFFDGLHSTSSGHLICAFLWIITLFAGTFGFLGNSLILYVLQNQKKIAAFEILLRALSWIDLLCCLSGIVATTSFITYLENWSRSGLTLSLLWFFGRTALFAKSASSFMTVVIAAERYATVMFPLKFRQGMTVSRILWLIFGVISFSFLMGIARYSSSIVEINPLPRDIPSISDAEYLIMSTRFTLFWYKTLKGAHNQIDFWTPLPLLLLFNGLVFWKVREFSRNRQNVNARQKDIRVLKMFVPVVIALILCNVLPIVHYAFIHSTRTAYRELDFSMYMSFTVNSAVNLPIYYYNLSGFKKEIREVAAKAGIQWVTEKSSDGYTATKSSDVEKNSSVAVEMGVTQT